MILYVLICMFQLLVEEVRVFTDLNLAKAEFERYTKMDYDHYKKELEQNDSESLLGDDEDTEIFEIDFTEGIFISEEDIVEELRHRLEREPSQEEITKFKQHMEVDIPQWLSDNGKSFVRD